MVARYASRKANVAARLRTTEPRSYAGASRRPGQLGFSRGPGVLLRCARDRRSRAPLYGSAAAYPARRAGGFADAARIFTFADGSAGGGRPPALDRMREPRQLIAGARGRAQT